MAKLPPTKQAPTKVAPVKSTPAAPVVTPGEKYSLVDLRDNVAAKLPLVAKATVEKVILATFEEMSRAFLSGKAVTIKDFGKLEVKHRPSRQGRNPATGDTITIPAKTVPKFTFAKKLKDGAK